MLFSILAALTLLDLCSGEDILALDDERVVLHPIGSGNLSHLKRQYGPDMWLNDERVNTTGMF